MRSPVFPVFACTIALVGASACTTLSSAMSAFPGSTCPAPPDPAPSAAVPVPGEPADTTRVGGWLGRYHRHICRGGVAT